MITKYKLKVALIGPAKPIGGISSHVRELAKGLRLLGDEVYFIPKIEDKPLSLLYYTKRLLSDFDIIHTQGLQNFSPLLTSLFSRMMLGPSIVATAHGFGGQSRWWYSTTQRKIMRSLILRYDSLITISRYVETRLRFFAGNSAPKIVTIYNGVDTSYFNPEVNGEPLRSTLGMNGRFVVLFVGRLAWNKGLEDLFEAVYIANKELPDIRLIVCGRGKLEKILREKVEALGLNNMVRFMGVVPFQQLPYYYAASDIVCCPSISEPFGLVPVEAMSSGRAVIATKVGGIPEAIIDGVTGILIPPKSPRLLASAILTLAYDESLRKEMGKRGRRLVEERFTLARMAKLTEQHYRELLECKN